MKTMTWFERILMVALATLGLIGILTIAGVTVDTASQYQMERERCLKQATNGYEIQQCR